MNTLRTGVQRTPVWFRGLAALSLVAGAWALSTSQAHARDNVYWSVGVSGPGVVIGASNAPVVVHRPPTYYYEQRPVVVAPPTVYLPAPPVVYAPPVVIGPRPIVYEGRPHWRGDRGLHRGHRHHDHRRDWDDDDRRGGGRWR